MFMDIKKGEEEFTFDRHQVYINEGEEVTLQVSRKNASQPSKVKVFLLSYTAKEGEDVAPLSTNTLSWDAGDSTSRSITVSSLVGGVEDASGEIDEKIYLCLGDPESNSDAILSPYPWSCITILDNDRVYATKRESTQFLLPNSGSIKLRGTISPHGSSGVECTLTWSELRDNVGGYYIYRRDNGGIWHNIHYIDVTVEGDVRKYVDYVGLANRGKYDYVIQRVDDDFSNVISLKLNYER